MHTKKHVISGVKPDSIAMELELEPGDELISINGKEIEDDGDHLQHGSDLCVGRTLYHL